MADIKHQLRLVGFPQCASDSLNIIESFITRQIPNAMVLVNEIVSEFIFCERTGDPKSKQKQHVRELNKLQELQLIEVLCAYFSHYNRDRSYSDNCNIQRTVFLCLFSGNDLFRDALLAKLVSMAVATRSRMVLEAAGIWWEQIGPTSQRGLALAKSIVNDYLNLVPGAAQQLNELPSLSPKFATHFLSAVAQLYIATGDSTSLPPESLLSVVTLWISKSPALCVSLLPDSPIIGLVRWCVLAPSHNTTDDQLYSKLHLAILESILSCGKDITVPASQLSTIVNTILQQHQHGAVKLKQSLDRLTQIIILLLRVANVSGNISELYHQMDLLPKNELLEGFVMCRNYLKSPSSLTKDIINLKYKK